MPIQESVLLAGLGFMCLLAIVCLAIAIFYLLTLQKALSRVSRRNRLMEPGMVWLMLIPLFNLVWNFFIATQIPDSLRNEFRDRGRDDGSDYGRGLGLTHAILAVVSVPLNLLFRFTGSRLVSLLMLPLALAGLVVFILFWVKIAGYSGQLAAPADYEDRGPWDDGGDDYDSRRPRRKSSDAIRPEDEGHYQ